MATQIDLITDKIAKDLGIDKLLIDQINRVQYKYLFETMQSGSMEGISMIYLGKFIRNARYNNDRKAKG